MIYVVKKDGTREKFNVLDSKMDVRYQLDEKSETNIITMQENIADILAKRKK